MAIFFIGTDDKIINEKELLRHKYIALALQTHGRLKIYSNEVFYLYNSFLFYINNITRFQLAQIYHTLDAHVVDLDFQEYASKLYQFIEKIVGKDIPFGFILLNNDEVICFGDNVGKKTIGIDDDFIVSTINFSVPFSNREIIKVNFLDKSIETCLKHTNFPEFSLNKNTKQQCMEGLMSLMRDAAKMHTYGDVQIFFSGGIDSFIAAVFILEYTSVRKMILINTSFNGEEAYDRRQSLLNYKTLKKKFPKKDILYLKNDVTKDELATYIPLIRTLVSPKKEKMQLNIAAVLFFTAKVAVPCTQVVLGSGADELFAGYKRYKISEDLKRDILKDFKSISNHNLSRDEHILSFHKINPRYPFLDHDIVEYALGLDIKMLINDENKHLLREMLRFMGYHDIANIKKTAMQFGSGIRGIEEVFIGNII